MELIYGANDEVSEWVSNHLFGEKDFFVGGKAIGIKENGCIICGVVYTEYSEDIKGSPQSMEMSIASIDRRWANRKNLNAFFAYPFIQLSVKRVQATTKLEASDTRAFLERCGFSLCGIQRSAHYLGGDTAVYDMLKDECKWIKNGQIGKNS